ncbi:MAG: Asp-tRNA(Asn)/Glu-tRNA(Gln) amidotransferase subunit GatB, partial [Methanobacteriaceae archaeon]
TFEEVVKKINSELAASWMRDELKRVLYYNKLSFKESGISSQDLVEYLELIDKKEVTAKAAKKIIEHMPNNDKTPKEIAKELGLMGVVNQDEVIEAAKKAVADNPEAVADYLEGKKASLNFLVGQVMRFTKGKADPGETVKIIKDLVD